jgi:hypothetical protein
MISTILLFKDQSDSIKDYPECANNVDFGPVCLETGNKFSELTNIPYQVPKQFRFHFLHARRISERPDGQPNPASRARRTACALSATCSLLKIFETWLRTVFRLSTNSSEIS